MQILVPVKKREVVQTGTVSDVFQLVYRCDIKSKEEIQLEIKQAT